MDDFFILIYLLFILLVLVCAFVLPIAALIISIRASRKLKHFSSLDSVTANPQQQTRLTAQLQNLEARLQQIEAILSTQTVQPTERTQTTPPVEPSPAPSGPPLPTPPPQSTAVTYQRLRASDVESIIGRRGIGWAAVILILFATAFFLKYAFDNRWIGEIGRVAIGLIFGVAMTTIGFRYFKRGWRIFSQIVTAG